MTMDFAFWKTPVPDPGSVFDRLAERDTTGLDESDDVINFRANLLERWPDLVDELEPPDYHLAQNPADRSKYVLLTLSVESGELWPQILELARHYELVGYSGVADAPL